MAVQFQGLEELILKLMGYSSVSMRALVAGMERAVMYVHSRIPSYPPKPATSTYRRTMTLWRSITTWKHPKAWSGVEVRGNQVVGYVGTRLGYAPYVIDKNRQAWFHRRNGWWTLQDVIAREQSGIIVECTIGYFLALNREFGGLVSP